MNPNISIDEDVSINIDHIEKNRNCEKLLGIKIDSKLNCKEHFDGIFKKASQKLNALSRVAPYINVAKRKLMMNSVFCITVQLLPFGLDVSPS